MRHSPTLSWRSSTGMTEIGSSATVLLDEQRLLEDPHARSCGVPVMGVRVRVLDKDGRALPRGQIGEIALRGPNVMSGDWRKPAETGRRPAEWRVLGPGMSDIWIPRGTSSSWIAART